MGKMHMMQLIEVNKKSYTKNKYPYYFYKQWHDPNDYKKRIEKTFVVRKGQSNIETPIKTKTTFGEIPDNIYTKRHEYLDKAHNSSFEERIDHLVIQYFGGPEERTPPDVLMKDKDPVEVFFTDKWFAECQRYFPVSPCLNYLGTFLEPYMKNITPPIDELCDVDIVFEPFTIMGKYMIGNPSHRIEDETENEKYVLNIYKSSKNVIPYKEDLVDCFASKIKRWHGRGNVWDYLDNVIRDLRRIEVYFNAKGIEPVYFNMDRDDYKETFGFEKNDLARTNTHPGDYPERDEYERIAKDYITKRKIKDMRRRGRKYDWI